VLYNYIFNKGILEECGKEENFEVIGAASTFCLKRRLFYAMSRILQVTARPASSLINIQSTHRISPDV